jgi:hypothetical protein
MRPASPSKERTVAADMDDRLRSAATVLAKLRTRRAGPRIGTLSNRPIHDFIESLDGARWIFDGKNFAGRVLAPSDIVHHQAVYSQVTR